MAPILGIENCKTRWDGVSENNIEPPETIQGWLDIDIVLFTLFAFKLLSSCCYYHSVLAEDGDNSLNVNCVNRDNSF